VRITTQEISVHKMGAALHFEIEENFENLENIFQDNVIFLKNRVFRRHHD